MHETKGLKSRIEELEGLLEITERKADILTNLLKEANAEFERALDLVTRTEKNFRAVVENAPEAIYIVDAQTHKILDCNPFTVNWLGYSREELLEKRVEDIAAGDPHQIKQNIRTALDRGIVRVEERRYLKKDGKVVDTELTGTSVEYGGKKCVAILVRDVTERKKLEDLSRYKELFESVSDPVLITDFYGHILEVNEGVCQITVRSREDLIGTSLEGLVKQEQFNLVAQMLTEVRNSETIQFEVELANKVGDSIPFEFRSRSIIYHGQSAVLSVARDLSIRRKLEETLIRTERLTAVGEMASGVAHNFNNILQMIMGSTQAAMAKLDAGSHKQCRESLSAILGSCDRGAEIVRRIRDFTHGRTDETVEASSFDLGELVREAVEFAKPLWETPAGSRGYDVEILEEGPSLVYGKPSEIYEVIVNLIKNAFEAMPDGGQLSLSTFDDDGKVHLDISDTGPGISSEAQQRIFEPFFTTKGWKSSGLGLSSSYGLVKKHHGEILVVSAAGEGTTFSIILPKATSSIQMLPRTAAPPVDYRLRILMVDDEINILKSAAIYFEDEEIDLVTAVGGANGFEMFCKGTFDAILCDLSMNDMSGLDVARSVKSFCQQEGISSPVFLIHTGWYETIDSQQLSEMGVDRVVTKPVRWEELIRIVRETIDVQDVLPSERGADSVEVPVHWPGLPDPPAKEA